MHYSDDTLLLLIEGELNWLRRAVAGRHLAHCMRCRAKAQALRNALDAAAFHLTREQIPSCASAAAKRRFQQWERSEGDSCYPGPAHRRLRWTGLAAAVTAAAITVAVLLRPPVEPPLNPASLLQAATERESREIKAEPTRQWLALNTTSATGVTTASRVELVSDPDLRRFVWRRYDAEGVLRQAAWKPAGGDYFVYQQNSVRSIAFQPAALEAPASGEEPLEQRILCWLLGEPWRPIRLAERFAQYAGRSGAVLTVAGAGVYGGRRAYSLIVSHPGSPLTLTMEILDGAPEGTGPAVASLRFVERGSGTVVTVRPRRIERLGSASLTAANFFPDVNLPRLPNRIPGRAAGAEVPSRSPTPLQEEVRLYHALFQSGALQDGEVSIRRANSGLLLEGVVRDAERRSQILAHVHPAAISVPLEIRLLTENEARAAAPSGDPSQAYYAAPVRAEHAAPWQKEVAGRYRNLGVSEAELPSKVADFGSRLVRLSAAALSSAWAARRIDERFSAAELSSLPEAEQTLVAEMKRQLYLSASRSLEDLESEIARVTVPSGERVVQPGVFEAIRLLDEEINALIAGESLGPASQTVTLGRVLALARAAAVETRTSASRLADEAARLRPPL